MTQLDTNPVNTRSTRLQTRITLIVIAAFLPIIAIWIWGAVATERQRLEDLLLQKAQATSVSGAAMTGQLFENAIASGQLTKDQVFDTKYIRFYTFDPALFPNFSDDPRTLDKYHTTYDAYTDQHIQKIIDSFLFDKDVIYAVPVDKNGYLPTHNITFSTGDGNPASDRTKRIFNDLVGIHAAHNLQPTLQQIYPRPDTGETLWDVSAPIYVNGEHWGAFRVGIELAENQKQIIFVTEAYLLSGLALVIFTSLFAWILGRFISAPIMRLTKAAKEFTSGNFDQQVNIQSRDEIGTLAEAFNTMTERLRTIISNLEGRTNELALSNERAKQQAAQLRLVAEVIRTTTTIRDLDTLFTTVTQMVGEQFDIYHVGIFLLDETRAFAILRAANSQDGLKMLKRGYHLSVDNQSIVGYVSTTGKARTATKIGSEADAALFNDADLPKTRSEAALPLKIAGEVIGVLDFQSSHPHAFDQGSMEALSILADQVSIAIQNTRLFNQTQVALQESELAYARQTNQTWKQYGAHQTASGYRYNGMETNPLTAPVIKQADGTLSVRVQLRGQTIGMLRLNSLDPERAWTKDEIALVEAAAERTALALENARLLEDAQKRAAKERTIGEISTKIGGLVDIDNIVQTTIQELSFALPDAEVAIQFQHKK